MPRQAANLTAAALIASLVLATVPALAAVNSTGDVKPVAPGGFGIPIGAPGVDDDGDNIADYIDDQGNNVFDNLADPNNPAGGNGLAWDNELIWVDYETTQNILVGENGIGLLEINGGSALRYQHLVLGGASESNAGMLELTTTGGQNDNYNVDFLTDMNNPATPRTGVGIVNVTGVGSVFNNAPNLISGDFQTALNFASGADVGTLVTTTPDPTARDDDEGFDVHVGLLGGGQLNVTAGGRVEIQDALKVGSASTAQGDVTVDGLGSYLAAYGRTNFEAGGGGGTTQDPGGVFASYIGGNGRGSLTVSDGGRADFFNGLSIGAANDAVRVIRNNDIDLDPQSSGAVVVMGNGSTLTVSPTGLLENGASLAVGELRENSITTLRYLTNGDLIDAPDGSQTLGNGSLRVDAGSRVVVNGTGSAEIGFNGVAELRGGELNVGGDIVNDGRIDGFGRVTGRTLDTSVYSIIRGGDPNAEPTSPSATPLRLVLAGEAGGDPDFVNPTVINRGAIEGLVDLRVTGDIKNGDGIIRPGRPFEAVGGRIEVGGQITARRLLNTAQSSLIGNSATGSPLLIRLDSEDQVNEGTFSVGNDPSVFGALQNYGTIAGDIEVTTPGGVTNGADLTSVVGNALGDPDGGTIRANGTIQAGSFINHRNGLIQVDPGKRLSVKTTYADPTGGQRGTIPIVLPGIVVGDGVDATVRPGGPDGEIDTGTNDAPFTIANLGKIVVNGGTFEADWIEENRDPIADGNIDFLRLFRNARQVAVDGASTTAAPLLDPVLGETIGTIAATDALLDFGQGIYNTGVVGFDGGTNTVRGVVYNAGFFRAGNDGLDGLPGTPDDVPPSNGIDYDTGAEEFTRPGVIVVSGDGTSVTFTDEVNNTGLISIGPNNNVVNFLGDLDNAGGTIQVALSPFATESVSAFITVGGEVRINGGSLVLNGGAGPVDPTNPSLATAPGPGPALALATAPEDFSLTVLEADGQLAEGSLFTNLLLPETPEGIYWDVIYDTAADEIRLELVESSAIGADFNNDNIVDQLDIDIWSRNVGIVGGASIIQGDANLDGRVDLGDYEQIMQQIFAGGTPVAFSLAVPEPAAMMLLCLAGVGFAASRRG